MLTRKRKLTFVTWFKTSGTRSLQQVVARLLPGCTSATTILSPREAMSRTPSSFEAVKETSRSMIVRIRVALTDGVNVASLDNRSRRGSASVSKERSCKLRCGKRKSGPPRSHFSLSKTDHTTPSRPQCIAEHLSLDFLPRLTLGEREEIRERSTHVLTATLFTSPFGSFNRPSTASTN